MISSMVLPRRTDGAATGGVAVVVVVVKALGVVEGGPKAETPRGLAASVAGFAPRLNPPKAGVVSEGVVAAAVVVVAAGVVRATELINGLSESIKPYLAWEHRV